MMSTPKKSLANRRNMNLDLSLSSPSSSESGGNSICNLDLTLSTPCSSSCENESVGERRKKVAQQQRLTIFYDGNVSVCEATEAEARAILECAQREAEEVKQRKLKISEVVNASPVQLYSSTEISMKRSLQKFLEKRKDRIQSAKVPYRR